jgi:hypothetical protein
MKKRGKIKKAKEVRKIILRISVELLRVIKFYI